MVYHARPICFKLLSALDRKTRLAEAVAIHGKPQFIVSKSFTPFFSIQFEVFRYNSNISLFRSLPKFIGLEEQLDGSANRRLLISHGEETAEEILNHLRFNNR
ncbi:hypothetical protein ACTXT7_006476 [Hymenolepis weldensis]